MVRMAASFSASAGMSISTLPSELLCLPPDPGSILVSSGFRLGLLGVGVKDGVGLAVEVGVGVALPEGRVDVGEG